MGGPPAYLAAETAPQRRATIVKVPTASAAHLAANEYFGLSSAMVSLSVRRVDGVDADGMSHHSVVWLWLVCGCRLQQILEDGCRRSLKRHNACQKSHQRA